MNKQELQTLHPELFASVCAEAAAEATAAERDRVTAHITIGKKAGMNGLVIALKAIESGEALTTTAQQRYFDAILNVRDQDARQADSDDAGRTADGALGLSSSRQDTGHSDAVSGSTAEEGDLGDQIVRRLETQRGHRGQSRPGTATLLDRATAELMPRTPPEPIRAQGDVGDEIVKRLEARRGHQVRHHGQGGA